MWSSTVDPWKCLLAPEPVDNLRLRLQKERGVFAQVPHHDRCGGDYKGFWAIRLFRPGWQLTLGVHILRTEVRSGKLFPVLDSAGTGTG